MNEGLTPCPELVRLNKQQQKMNFSFGAGENVENFNITAVIQGQGKHVMTFIPHWCTIIQNSLWSICDWPAEKN